MSHTVGKGIQISIGYFCATYPHVATDDSGELRHELLVLVDSLHHLGRRLSRLVPSATAGLRAVQVILPFPLGGRGRSSSSRVPPAAGRGRGLVE